MNNEEVLKAMAGGSKLRASHSDNWIFSIRPSKALKEEKR